jgi:hypothetical protein
VPSILPSLPCPQPFRHLEPGLSNLGPRIAATERATIGRSRPLWRSLSGFQTRGLPSSGVGPQTAAAGAGTLGRRAQSRTPQRVSQPGRVPPEAAA